MIKLDIVNAIVQKTNITRTKAEQAVETVFEAMKNALGRGDRIELRRFGVFNVKPRKTGIGRNPRTGQQVSIPLARPCDSSPERNCKRCLRPALRRKSLSRRERALAELPCGVSARVKPMSADGARDCIQSLCAITTGNDASHGPIPVEVLDVDFEPVDAFPAAISRDQFPWMP